MSDLVNSLIRTYVPLGVGVLVTWLASFGVHIDSTATAALAAGLGAVAAALWYTIVRALERRWPALGALVGSPKAPTYAKPAVSSGSPDKPAPTAT